MKNRFIELASLMGLCVVLGGCGISLNDVYSNIADSANSEEAEKDETSGDEASANDGNSNVEDTDKEDASNDGGQSAESRTDDTQSAESRTDDAQSAESRTDDAQSAESRADAALIEEWSATYKAILEERVTIDDGEGITILCDDFDLNGSYEAFAFVGIDAEDSSDWGVYEGDIWYVDENECISLIEDSLYWNVLKLQDFGKRKYVDIAMYYATDSPTVLYTVRGNTVEKCESIRFGAMYNINGTDFMVTQSAYDGYYDAEFDMTTTHTWKPYFYYYDEVTDSIREYGQHDIDIAEAESLFPKDAVNTIYEYGGEITRCFLRDNGIVTICYEIKSENGSIEYCNANYDTVNKCYLDAFSPGTNTLEGSNFGGTY